LLKGISIRNFRGILQSDITGFNQFNVFIGEFGSGKSTVLDAVYLMKLNFEKGDCLKRIMTRRTGSTRTPDLTSLWYTYQPSHQISVKYAFQDSSYEVQLQTNPGDPTRVNVNTIADGGHASAQVLWNGDSYQGTIAVGKEEIPARKVVLLDDEMLRRVFDIEREILDPMKKMPLDRKFLEMLNGIFPTSEGYEFLSASPRQPQDFRCYLTLKDAKVRIDDISDGLRNGFAILSTAFMLTGTILLLEEPENNMYPKALDKLLEGLVRVCKSNRVQLFVTTHRPEVLASLVDYGKELTTIFHFSRKDGDVRAVPIEWNDTRILLEIGWDVGKLAKGYEKYVIVEGDTDKLVLDESFHKLKGVIPESLWITIVPSGGIDGKFVDVFKALLLTGKEIFALPDLDNKSSDERRKQLEQSVRQLGSQGYTISSTENGVIEVSKGDIRSDFRLENILPCGDPNGLKAKGFDFKSFSMDDYLLETILLNPQMRGDLAISDENLKESKKCRDAKSAVRYIMRLDNERIRKLIRNSSLPDGLIQIVRAITGKE
jgi:predicted ATPase